MQLQISTRDGIPIYLQIVNQVKYLVAAERLAPGEALPSVRKLAEQLVINPNTVARAYRELESAGVLATRRGAGGVCFSPVHVLSPGRRGADDAPAMTTRR